MPEQPESTSSERPRASTAGAPAAAVTPPAPPHPTPPVDTPQPPGPADPEKGRGVTSLRRDDWHERARFEFGASPHAMRGALSDVDPGEELSREQVQALLDEFSVREGT